MINFAVGPVQSPEDILALGMQSSPYFRTDDFSEVMLESERMILDLVGAPQGSRACFVTGSGTAAMEAAVSSLLSSDDRALVIDGGSFGHRFKQLLELHGVPSKSIALSEGTPLTEQPLKEVEASGLTSLLVNIHETSTGVLYDAKLLASFCAENDLFFVVDAISSFLADPLDMDEWGADVVITGSQKALACPPGVSIVVMSPRAIRRAKELKSGGMYLDLSLMLENGERGQTPFTPAVTTLLQIHQRLLDIERVGVQREIERVAGIASLFRSEAADLPFELRLASPSNACTYCSCDFSAKRFFSCLKDEYGIWICPNGGKLADSSFRVGHIGDLSPSDVRLLIAAMRDVLRRGIV